MTEGRTLIEKVRELLAEVWAGHRDPHGSLYNQCEQAPCAWCSESKDAIEALLQPATTHECKARKSACDPPQDCDWPFCGCDPVADRVIEAIEDSGRYVPKSHLTGTQGKDGDVAWVIEMGSGPAYWDGRGENTFSYRHDEAVRFARFEDAERVRAWMVKPLGSACRSVQHAWTMTLHPEPEHLNGTGWQPIETAPKDGTPVLLMPVGCKKPVVGYFSDLFTKPWHAVVLDADAEWNDMGQSPIFEATHWMPVPGRDGDVSSQALREADSDGQRWP